MKGYWKSATGAATVLFGMTYGVFFMQWGEDYHLTSALEEYKEGKLQQAQRHLEQIGESPELRHLGLAYVYRELYDLENSDRQLQAALRWMEKKENHEILAELYLNLALNRMLQNDPVGMGDPLALARAEGGESRSWRLLAAFSAQQVGESKVAIQLFDSIPQKWEGSPWVRSSFPRYLSSAWTAINKGEALIDQGEHVEARQVLQKNEEDANREQIQQIEFLIGITHLKEGDEIPFPASIPYYKLALSFFEKIDPICLGDKISPIKNQLMAIGTKLLENNSCSDFVPYVSLLKKWDAKDELEVLNDAIEREVDLALKNKNGDRLLELSRCVDCVGTDPDLQKRIIGAVTDQISCELNAGNRDKAEELWKAALLISDDPVLLKDHVKRSAKEQIIAEINSDSISLTKTGPSIDLVDIIEKDSGKRFEFASFLIALSNTLWQKDRMEQQALEILKRSDLFPYLTERPRYLSQVEGSLKHLYRHNMGSDQVMKVPTIVEAIRYFDLKGVEFQNETIIANQYADAKYLANQNRYDESLAKLRLVFSLNPSHSLGRELEGSICFFKGDFNGAKQALDGIKDRTTDGNQIYGSALILTGAPNEGWPLWKQAMEAGPLNSKILERLGIELILQGKGEDGDRCLAKASQITPPGMVARFYYAVETQNWSSAYSLFNSLPPSYQQLQSIKLLMVRCLTGMGDIKQAEKILENELENSGEIEISVVESPFPIHFLNFKKSVLDPIDPNITAAEFYLYGKNQPEKGLSFLIKSSPKDPKAILLKGNALEKVGDFELAIETLRELKGNRDAYSALFRIYCSLNRYAQAYDLYHDMGPLTPEEELQALFMLNETKRWDEIISLLTQKENHLEGFQLPLYARAMMGQGKFFDAGEFIREHLGEEFGNESNLNQLNEFSFRLAELSVQLPNTVDLNFLWTKFNTIESLDSLSLADQEALLSLALTAGNIALADRIEDHAKIHLEKSVQGQLLIARLESALGEEKRALEAIIKAFEIDPSNRALVKQIDQIRCPLNTAEQLIGKFQKKIQPESDPFMQLIQIEALTTLFFAHKNGGNLPVCQYHSSLSEIEERLNRIEPESTKLADFHLQKGFLYMNQNRNQLARQEFEEVIKRNALEPLAHLALSELKMDKMPEEAISHLEKAVMLAPWRNDWRADLIELFMEQGQVTRAAEQISDALSYSPRDQNLLVQAAAIYRERGATADAYATLVKAHKLEPKAVRPLVELMKALQNPDWASSDEERDRLRSERNWALEELQGLDPKAAMQFQEAASVK